MVYFIQYGNDGPVKIGKVYGNNGRSVSHRLMALQCATPTKLRIIGFIEGGEQEERALHDKFRKYRVSGEWFELNEDLLDTIREASKALSEELEIQEDTISQDELTKIIQDRFNIDMYFQEISQKITTLAALKKIPSYVFFGKRRYRPEEIIDILTVEKIDLWFTR